MPIHYRCDVEKILIVGHTFPFKDILKNLGAQYDQNHKNWYLPHSQDALAKIVILCRQTGGGELPQTLGSGDNKNPPPPEHLAPPPKKNLPPSNQENIEEKTSIALARSSEPTLSLQNLMDHISNIIRHEYAKPIWVIAEIQNLNQRLQGVFLNLVEPKDSENQSSATLSISATLWQSKMRELQKTIPNLTLMFKEGVKIRCQVQVSFYRDRGQISLNIVNLDENFSLGMLALARQKLVKELKSKNFYDANKRLKLPLHIKKIGLITASGSRAYSDFVDQLAQHSLGIEILFFSAPMQGEESPSSVARGLEQLKSTGCQMVVITRGGGSSADLRWFDNPILAYAVASYPLPILAAIGHHDDQSILEEICYQREKTPTAAAQFFVASKQKCLEDIARSTLLLSTTLTRKMQRAEEKYLSFQNRLQNTLLKFWQKTEYRLNLAQIRLGELGLRRISQEQNLNLQTQQKLTHKVELYLQNQGARIDRLELQLKSSDPRPWLIKGWTQLIDIARGTVIKSVDSAPIDAILKAPMVDGELRLQVKEQKFTQEKNEASSQIQIVKIDSK